MQLTRSGEQGTFILKPVPADVPNGMVLPANEHLAMQIAAQIYGIQTVANALVFFPDGQPAYLTKRFDVAGDGRKIHMEYFASLTGKTSDTDGKDAIVASFIRDDYSNVDHTPTNVHQYFLRASSPRPSFASRSTKTTLKPL